jgi:hypothetical protein
VKEKEILEVLAEQMRDTTLALELAEISHREAKAGLETAKQTTLALAYAKGAIDGKNADVRRAQEALVLSVSQAVSDAKEVELGAAELVAHAIAEHAYASALTSLTRALLYSKQGGNT